MSDEIQRSQHEANATPEEIGAAAVDKAFEDIQSPLSEATPEPVEIKNGNNAMEIHKPKPVHSWRELLTEICVIVIGVAIALAGEQTVEWFHWESRVAQARSDLAIELAGVMRNGIERVRFAKCTEDRLDALAKILDGAVRSGNLPPVGPIGSPPSRPYSTSTWQSVSQSQTASHFPSRELNAIGLIYNAVQHLGDTNLLEMAVWSDLSAMAGPGRRLDPSLESTLQTSLARARFYNRFMASVGGSEVSRIASLNLPFTAGDRQQIDARLHDLSPNGQSDICALLSNTPPSSYGQLAPFEWVSGRMKALQTFPPFRGAGAAAPANDQRNSE